MLKLLKIDDEKSIAQVFIIHKFQIGSQWKIGFLEAADK